MMPFWRRKKDDFELMDDLIEESPGILPAELARRLGLRRSTVTRRLPSADEAGYFYYEDERGGLWPFRKRKP